MEPYEGTPEGIAHAGADAPSPIPLSRELQTTKPAPIVRQFLARYGPAYGVTWTGLASQLGLDDAELAAYAAGAVATPRWLPLALAGVGTTYGVPSEELRWLVAFDSRSVPGHFAAPTGAAHEVGEAADGGDAEPPSRVPD